MSGEVEGPAEEQHESHDLRDTLAQLIAALEGRCPEVMASVLLIEATFTVDPPRSLRS